MGALVARRGRLRLSSAGLVPVARSLGPAHEACPFDGECGLSSETRVYRTKATDPSDGCLGFKGKLIVSQGRLPSFQSCFSAAVGDPDLLRERLFTGQPGTHLACAARPPGFPRGQDRDAGVASRTLRVSVRLSSVPRWGPRWRPRSPQVTACGRRLSVTCCGFRCVPGASAEGINVKKQAGKHGTSFQRGPVRRLPPSGRRLRSPPGRGFQSSASPRETASSEGSWSVCLPAEVIVGASVWAPGPSGGQTVGTSFSRCPHRQELRRRGLFVTVGTSRWGFSPRSPSVPAPAPGWRGGRTSSVQPPGVRGDSRPPGL